MPTTKETVKTTILVGAEWDKKSLKELDRDFGKVRKKLSGMKMDWKGVSRESTTAVRDIKNISNAAAEFSKDLSRAARTSIKDLAKLGKELDAAKKKARELKEKAASASSPEEEKAAAVGISEAQKEVERLTRQVREHRKVDKQYVHELKTVVKAQKRYSEDLKKSASYTGKDFRKDFASSMKSSYMGGRQGSPMSALKGVHGVYKAGKQYSAGVSARSALAKSGAGGAGGAGGPGGLAVGLSKLVPILGGAIAGFAAFLGFIMKCSDAITAMNKTLLDGTGLANDFTAGSKAYTTAVDQMRASSKDATLGLLKFGGTTETTAKTVNAYMKEASGSIIQTRDTMLSLGRGDATKGVELLAKNALLYGKALGIETTEIASMMGKFENEVGYGAGQVQDLMGDIVKAAATSNMPVSKFMSIFHSVTPDLELYINRIEELTGVMKLLSKNMSPGDVKKFMDAFGKGFQGMSFTDRVQTAVVAGVDQTNKLLEKDFRAKAAVLGGNLNELGGKLGDQFVAAFKTGDKKTMQDILIKAKAAGASASTIGEASKLMGVESDRRMGGAIGTASAMKGAGMWTTIKTLMAGVDKIVGKNAGQGERISGFRELAATGPMKMSEAQIDAMNQMISSMELYTKSIKDYGSTGSKSIDDALKKIMSARLGKPAEEITAVDLSRATEDDIAAATEASNDMSKDLKTVEDLSQEQTDATLSIGDKLSNVIGYILEQIYEKMSSLVKIVSDIFNSILDWASGGKAKVEQKAKIEQYKIKGYGGAEQKSFEDLKSALKEGVESGDATKAASDYYKSQREQLKKESVAAQDKYEKIDPKDTKAKEEAMAAANAAATAVENFDASLKKNITDLATKGMHPAQAKNVAAGISSQLEKGDIGGAFGAAKAYSGDDAGKLLTLGQNMLPTAVTQADRDAATRSGPMMRRAGTSDRTIRQKFDPKADKEIRDTVSQAQLDANAAMIRAGKGGKGTTTAQTNKAVQTAQVAQAKNASELTSFFAEATPADQVAAVENQTETLSKGALLQAKEQEVGFSDQAKVQKDVYDGITDVASLLKKGIRYESGFLRGAYTEAIKTATLDSFSDALLEFAVIQAKMQNNAGFRGFMSDYSQSFVNMDPRQAMGLLTGEIGKGSSGDPNAIQKQFEDTLNPPKASMQVGGPIPDTGLYKLHRGEYVVPSVAVGNDGSGGGGGIVNATVNINGSNLTQQQLESAVFGAMDKIARRP